MSDAANALKVGVPDDPDGAANTVPVACETKENPRVPDDVIGEPDTDRKDGTVAATDVTVPDDDVAHAGAPDTTVKT